VSHTYAHAVTLLPTGGFGSAVLAGESVTVTFAGGEMHALLGEWLRDHCPCTVCRITQTDERRIRTWEYDAPVAKDCSVNDGQLTISWADGHESSYDAGWVEATNRALLRNTHEVRLWGQGDALERFNYDSVVASTDARQSLFEAFVRDGAVVVEGSPTFPGSVVEFVRTIGLTLLDSSLGFIFDVKLDPTGYNVAFTSEALPLHNDNAQYAQPPGGQVLAMLVNEASGGESVVADGWAVLNRLQEQDPAAIDVLCEVEVGFRQYSPESDGFWRSPMVVRDSTGAFTHLRFSNQLMQPIDPIHPKLAEWYRAYRLLGRMVHDQSSAIRFRLRGGDYLMVNGYRVLHARDAYVADGPRHLQDVYFCAQDVFDRLASMKGVAQNAMVQS
jgi:gamma-butyrobetaine dioxygenase